MGGVEHDRTAKVSGSPRDRVRPHALVKTGRFAVIDDAPVEVIESGPSIAARLVSLASRLTIRPTLAVCSRVPHLPWPFGLVDFASQVLRPAPSTIRAMVGLPNASAQLVRAPGVLPADGNRRVVLYLHGGAFLTCGTNSHSRVVNALSRFADSPVLVVNYRLSPKHSVGMALNDCHDAYRWLRRRGYEPDQIVLAGDSAGGYLALALAQRLQQFGEQPAALVAISPLMQLAKKPKQAHPNIKTDAMLPAKAFDALVALAASAASKHIIDGKPEELYEPLDHVQPGLPRTLIHVSGSEVLLYDAQLAARTLAAAGVPAEVRIWPSQIHDFQLAAPLCPRRLARYGKLVNTSARPPTRHCPRIRRAHGDSPHRCRYMLARALCLGPIQF